MIIKSTFFSLFAMIAFIGSTYAELRIWTDVNGKSIEAEHVRTLADKVVLRQTDGSEMRVSLDTLSERDRRYAILQTPPRIDISVATDADRSNSDYGNRGNKQVQEETISVNVRIRKSSPPPYESPLAAELYLIGSPENKDGYMILEKWIESFSFTADNEHAFESKDVSLQQLEAGRQKGVEYKGYLIAVKDQAGDILSIKCSKLNFEKNAEAILAGVKGTKFDAEFKVIEPERKKKSRTSESSKNNQLPGRRF